MQILGDSHQTDNTPRLPPDGHLVGQTPPLLTRGIDLQLKLIENGLSGLQQQLVLGPIALAQGIRVHLIRGQADDLLFGTTGASLHQGLIHHHILALRILDEVDHVRHVVKECFTSKRPFNPRKQILPQILFHEFIRIYCSPTRL